MHEMAHFLMATILFIKEPPPVIINPIPSEIIKMEVKADTKAETAPCVLTGPVAILDAE